MFTGGSRAFGPWPFGSAALPHLQVVCALIRVDSARQPLTVEIEFSSSKEEVGYGECPERPLRFRPICVFGHVICWFDVGLLVCWFV